MSSIIFSPPKIEDTAKLYEVAKHMIAAKIYMLPVFTKEGAVNGVVYSKDVVSEVIKNKEIMVTVRATFEL